MEPLVTTECPAPNLPGVDFGVRSEWVILDEIADFQPTPDADNGPVRVKRSKTDQAGHGAERLDCPACRDGRLYSHDGGSRSQSGWEPIPTP